MTPENCRLYFEDPEANRAHLDQCASCRAMVEELEQAVAHRPLNVARLPLAPWEGATHRSWPLVVGGALTLLAITTALYAAAGVSPAILIERFPSLSLLGSMFRLTGGAIRNAPAGWQIGIAISFILVNALLILLLRRAPKGIDV